MSTLPNELHYSKDHEWVLIQGDLVLIGITDHAQSELGDIVFVEFPKVGATLRQNDCYGTIEAVKTVAELYAPISGQVVELNPLLNDTPELINSDAYGSGWILKIKPSNLAELEQLLSADQYSAHIGG